MLTVNVVQLSDDTGVPNATPVAEQLPASADTDTLAGAVSVGFSLSTTVTTCSAVTIFPLPSLAVHVTVVVPNG